MLGAINAIFDEASKANVNTEVEFAVLQAVTPHVVMKLDLDPTPLESGEEDELEFPTSLTLTEADVGKRYALIRCANAKYLVLCEVR